ncbi:MAG: PepSY domain-containing protein [Opitutaceae bacterium]
MSLQMPRKRTILAWHRWMGIASAIFLVVLSITGLALNHTERLGLNQVTIRNSFILDRYGMAAGNEITAYRIHKSNTIAHLDGQLFYNARPLSAGHIPLGIVEGDPISVIATQDELLYLTSAGELIEKLDTTQLPYAELTAVGTTIDGKPVLITDEGRIAPDEDWLAFDSYQASYNVDPLKAVELDAVTTTAILDQFQGGGVTLYRVLLDLHSGRLFGWGGRTLMDLSAIAIILLVTSGLTGWLRKSRRQRAENIAK